MTEATMQLRMAVPTAGEGEPHRCDRTLLTARELNILKCIADGCSNKHIARRLSVSPDTIKSDLKATYSKLRVSNRTHAVVVASRRGHLNLDEL